MRQSLSIDIDYPIEVSGARKRFGAVAALDGLDLRVRRGEVHGFLGPNGAGKSTTIRALLGQIRLSGGRATVYGADPWRYAPSIHEHVAYVPGDTVLWPNLTGGECIDLISRLQGSPDARRRAELVERFDLDPRRRAGTYSKGNRQKVALISALATQASLLILDEPTSGLDPVMERQFIHTVKELVGEGRTVLLSSHLMSEIDALCDRVTIIRGGRTVITAAIPALRAQARVAIQATFPHSLSPGVLPEGATATFEDGLTVSGPSRRHRHRDRPHRKPAPGSHRRTRHVRRTVLAALRRGHLMSVYSGSWRLLVLQVRTGWRSLLLSPIVLAGLVAAVAVGVKELYADATKRAGYAATLGSSLASITLNGRAYDLDQLGGVVAYEVGFLGQLAIPATGVLLSVSLTRRQEECGYLDLVTSTRVDRLAPLRVTAVTILLCWGSFAALAALGLVALGYPADGSVRYAICLGAFGLCWSGVGLLVAQTARTSRGAAGAGLMLGLVGYLTRAVADAQSASWTRLSPMSWVPESRAWDLWDARPTLALVMLGVGATAGAALLTHRRDLGSGLFAERRGAERGMQLASPWRLALRLNRTSLAGWLAGAVLWTGTLGLMTRDFTDAVAINPGLAQMLGGENEDFAAQIALMVSACCAAAAGLTVALRFGAEETQGRLGLLLAGRRPRWGWWLSWHAVALLTAALVLLSAAAALGVGQWHALHDSAVFFDAMVAGLYLVAPVWAMVAVGMMLVGAVPRVRGFAWAPVIWALIVGLLSEPLRLPSWAKQLSALELVGRVPAEQGNPAAALLLGALAVALVIVGGAQFARRSLLCG